MYKYLSKVATASAEAKLEGVSLRDPVVEAEEGKLELKLGSDEEDLG